VPPAIIVPIALSAVAIWLSLTRTAWTLIALPFILLGSVCAAPNFNLADGFIALIAMMAGMILLWVHPFSGEPVCMGSFFSWTLSSVEKRIRAVPIRDA